MRTLNVAHNLEIPVNTIYETAVYCGRTKVWRILNLNTGTIYVEEFKTNALALAAIEDGTVRGASVVQMIPLVDIVKTLDNTNS